MLIGIYLSSGPQQLKKSDEELVDEIWQHIVYQNKKQHNKPITRLQDCAFYILKSSLGVAVKFKCSCYGLIKCFLDIQLS